MCPDPAQQPPIGCPERPDARPRARPQPVNRRSEAAAEMMYRIRCDCMLGWVRLSRESLIKSCGGGGGGRRSKSFHFAHSSRAA